MAEDESSNPSQSDFSESDAEDQEDFGEESGDGLDAAEDLPQDLAGQSFEEILALKDRVGLRTYKTAIGLEEVGTKKKRKKVFKRDNKNRPRELSSKIPVTGVRNIFNVKKKVRADPRFEDGFEEVQPRNRIKAEHRAKQKTKEYAFIDRIRERERKEIEESLTSGKFDEAEASKARKLLQKVRSREISQRQLNIRKELDEKYTEFLKSARETGQQVKYMTKKDKKKAELVMKFNQLKSSNKLEKYLEKKRKRNLVRDRKKMEKAPTG